MKLFRNQYLLICGIPILLLAGAGTYWIVRKHQPPVDKGTQIGNFWFPPMAPGWSKKVYKSDMSQSLIYYKRINNTSTIFVVFLYFPPNKGSQPTKTAMMAMLRRSEKAPIGKKILKFQSHQTHYRSWPAWVCHEVYITEPIYIRDIPGYNGVYGKMESNVRVDETTMDILCPSDWYGLSVLLRGRGKGSTEAQALKKSVWQLITRQLQFSPDNSVHVVKRDTKKNCGVLRGGPTMRYQCIKTKAPHQEIALWCAALDVSRSAYYNWLEVPRRIRAVQDEAVKNGILQINEVAKQRYGYRAMQAHLQANSVSCGKDRVLRLMRDLGIVQKRGKRFKPVGTNSKHPFGYHPNLLKGSDVPSKSGQIIL